MSASRLDRHLEQSLLYGFLPDKSQGYKGSSKDELRQTQCAVNDMRFRPWSAANGDGVGDGSVGLVVA